MNHLCCLAVLFALLPMAMHAQDLNGDGELDLQDANAAQTEEELEEVLATVDHPRGDLDGDREVSFADFLIFANNYGRAGDYTQGDLDLDGGVGFEDWPFHAVNFGRRGHFPPPPIREPGDPFTVSVDAASGRIVLSGGRAVLNGLRVQSASGALLPRPHSQNDPFEFALSSTPFEVSFASIVKAEESSDELIIPVGILEGTEISEIEFTWSRPGGYQTFDFVHGAILPGLPGDFDMDGVLTPIDMDLLSHEVLTNGEDQAFNLNGDQVVDQLDRELWVEELAGTRFGDADLDGSVQFNDFLTLSDNFGQEGGWSAGDFDGSGDIQFADFLLLSASFAQVAANTQSVPEPNCLAVVVSCLLFVHLLNRRQ